MNKNWILLAVALICLFIAVTYPSFLILKPYGNTGGYAEKDWDRVCDCRGISYTYVPENCYGCYASLYCLGFVTDCKCNSQNLIQPKYIGKINALPKSEQSNATLKKQLYEEAYNEISPETNIFYYC
ncbi:hypothetical protein FJZ53_03475 [Candidatus Woesearchaeota archaeon]|nr:hypothetical protein [Candidatus Woesearchaeota archaeon]